MLKSHNVQILHATPMFRAFDAEETMLRRVYTYQCDNPDDLEHIFRWNNVVDGSELPVEYGTRSLSVGDVVGVRDFDGKWSYHQVLGTGWDTIAPELVDQALERNASWDPFQGL